MSISRLCVTDNGSGSCGILCANKCSKIGTEQNSTPIATAKGEKDRHKRIPQTNEKPYAHKKEMKPNDLSRSPCAAVTQASKRLLETNIRHSARIRAAKLTPALRASEIHARKNNKTERRIGVSISRIAAVCFILLYISNKRCKRSAKEKHSKIGNDTEVYAYKNIPPSKHSGYSIRNTFSNWQNRMAKGTGQRTRFPAAFLCVGQANKRACTSPRSHRSRRLRKDCGVAGVVSINESCGTYKHRRRAPSSISWLKTAFSGNASAVQAM